MIFFALVFLACAGVGLSSECIAMARGHCAETYGGTFTKENFCKNLKAFHACFDGTDEKCDAYFNALGSSICSRLVKRHTPRPPLFGSSPHPNEMKLKTLLYFVILAVVATYI
ncbi:uncharacterized protein LOC128249757 [Octopus bimaculoides]|uniref:uncharacterized protein LOC128249757 n=1 Tax=Octopus bimaculoides TaxID=37653 RepID=UPI0022E32FFE|nr:uncharacterized protein LOC128249757 [Octopus bimaculoides]